MIGPPFFLVFLGRVRKEEEEEDMKEEELVEEGCLFRGTVFTCPPSEQRKLGGGGRMAAVAMLQKVGALGLLLPGQVQPKRAGSSPFGNNEAASKCWICGGVADRGSGGRGGGIEEGGQVPLGETVESRLGISSKSGYWPMSVEECKDACEIPVWSDSKLLLPPESCPRDLLSDISL